MNTAHITPENVLSVQHNDWLAHPITIQAVKNLSSYEKHFVDKLASVALNADTSDETIRRYAVVVKTIRSIKAILTNTEIFINVAENKIKE